MTEDPIRCWFCHRPVLSGQPAHRAPRAALAVHADCLRDDAAHEGLRPLPDEALA